MHVVLDCRYAFPHLSGIGRYTVNLACGLAEVDPALRLTLLAADREHLSRYLPKDHRFTLIDAGQRPRSPGEQYRLRRLLRSLKPDVFHTPDAFAPLLKVCPTVITIHDLIPLACPQATGGLKSRLKAVWSAWLKVQTRRADAVLTCSQHSRDDIRRLLGVDSTVAYPGVLPAPVTVPAAKPGEPTVLDRVGEAPFFLFVGRREPYKNIAGLIRAIALLPEKHRQTRLVLAGHRDPRFPEPEVLSGALGVADRVITTGQLCDGDLELLYRRAAGLALVSYYEGFGYPPLEALARGTPVLVSRLSSLPEVLGDAGIYADADDPTDIAARMHDLLSTPTPHPTLAHAPATLARYTIELQARSTLAAYTSILR